MKLSTITVFKKHGWRIDRAIHNILYFVYYAPYVKVAIVSTKFLTKYLNLFLAFLIGFEKKIKLNLSFFNMSCQEITTMTF